MTTIRTFILALAVACTSFSPLTATLSHGATFVPGGLVSGVWTPTGSPYIVQGDISVNSSSELRISSGTRVQVADFDALGTGSNPGEVEIIVDGQLTIQDADIVPQNGNPSSWVGVETIAGSTLSFKGSRIDGNLNLSAGADYLASLANTGASVMGAVSLGGNLVLSAGGVAPQPGTTYLLIENDGIDPVMGTFSGLPEASIISLSGMDFTLTYLGGTGNDVALSAVPIPAAAWLFSCGLGLLACIRRIAPGPLVK